MIFLELHRMMWEATNHPDKIQLPIRLTIANNKEKNKRFSTSAGSWILAVGLVFRKELFQANVFLFIFFDNFKILWKLEEIYDLVLYADPPS